MRGHPEQQRNDARNVTRMRSAGKGSGRTRTGAVHDVRVMASSRAPALAASMPDQRAAPKLVASGRDGQGRWMLTPFYAGRAAAKRRPERDADAVRRKRLWQNPDGAVHDVRVMASSRAPALAASMPDQRAAPKLVGHA